MGDNGQGLLLIGIGALLATGFSYLMTGLDLKSKLDKDNKRKRKLLSEINGPISKDMVDDNTLKSRYKGINDSISIPEPYVLTPRNQMIDKGGIYPGSLDDLDSNDFPYGNNFPYYYLDKKNREDIATHLSFAARKPMRKIGSGAYQHTTSNQIEDSNHVFSIVGDKY